MEALAKTQTKSSLAAGCVQLDQLCCYSPPGVVPFTPLVGCAVIFYFTPLVGGAVIFYFTPLVGGAVIFYFTPLVCCAVIFYFIFYFRGSELTSSEVVAVVLAPAADEVQGLGLSLRLINEANPQRWQGTDEAPGPAIGAAHLQKPLQPHLQHPHPNTQPKPEQQSTN